MGMKLVPALSARSWCRMPTSGATSPWLPAGPGGPPHPASGREHPRAVGGQVAVADEVEHRGGAAALGVHEDLGVRVGGDLRTDVGGADPGVHVALPRPDRDVLPA